MEQGLPEGFVYLRDVDASIAYDIKYATKDNLLGRVVAGYQANVCICTLALAEALARLQAHLRSQNLALLVFETYRPEMAGTDVFHWTQDLSAQSTKAEYYPNVAKEDFYDLGYVVRQSAHTRGSTVDLTLVDLQTEQALDMGTPFDFMDSASHPADLTVSAQVYSNRQFLQQVMQEHGFNGIETEWWHFTLANEPFPENYFTFPVAV